VTSTPSWIRSCEALVAGRPARHFDTSTLILLGRLAPSAPLPAVAFISAITLAELSVGPLVASTGEVRAARQAHLQQAEADFEDIGELVVIEVPHPDRG